jgi:type II secretory pathway component PulF
MDFSPEITAGFLTVLMACVWLAVIGGALMLIHFVLTLPMQRAERARRFLDLIDTAHKQGQPVEETLISVAESRDLSMGVRFHLLAAWLEQNLPLGEALAKVPRFLPPQVTAMLLAGRKIGDLRKVLPACRQLLKDGVSQTRGAINYLVLLTFVLTPFGIIVVGFLKVAILPKFLEISEGIGQGGLTGGVQFVLSHALTWMAIQTALLLLMWLAAFVYMGGPRVAVWFTVLQFLHHAGHFAGWRCSRTGSRHAGR